MQPLATIEDVKSLARLAGGEIMKFFRKSHSSHEKSGFEGVVTEADIKAETLIKNFVQSKFPSHFVLAEESGLSAKYSQDKKEILWIVDPLDGTSNFSNGTPNFNVSIGVVEVQGDIVEPLMGVIYHPPMNRLYWAERGQGAFVDFRDEAGLNQTQKMKVFDVPDSALGLYATGVGYNREEALKKIFDGIFRVQSQCRTSSVRIFGAAALDLAHVADSQIQGYFESTLKPWDTAAGALICKEAGARVTNWQGEPFHILKHQKILAAPPRSHEWLIQLLGEKNVPS